MNELSEAQVLEGKEGYLFLTNDSNRVIDQVEGRFVLSERGIWNIAATHAARRAFCQMLGAEYHHVVVPDRETVYAHLLPDTVKPGSVGPRPLQQYRNAGADALHPIVFEPSILSEQKDPPAYPKNDTHWSFAGAERYARFIADLLGADPNLLDFSDAIDHTYENPGDLGSKIGHPPVPFSLRISTDPAVKPIYDDRLMNVGRLRITGNEKRPQGERWLVLHDSFGELLALMLPLCAHKICFVHTSDFDEVFALRYRPTRVLMLQIERFFVREPYNGMDWLKMIGEQHERKSGEEAALLPPLTDDLIRP